MSKSAPASIRWCGARRPSPEMPATDRAVRAPRVRHPPGTAGLLCPWGQSPGRCGWRGPGQAGPSPRAQDGERGPRGRRRPRSPRRASGGASPRPRTFPEACNPLLSKRSTFVVRWAVRLIRRSLKTTYLFQRVRPSRRCLGRRPEGRPVGSSPFQSRTSSDLKAVVESQGCVTCARKLAPYTTVASVMRSPVALRNRSLYL